MALTGQAVSEKKLFEYYGHIHVYSPREGADNPLGQKYFHKHTCTSSVHLLTPSKFSAIEWHFPIFPHSNAWATLVDLATKKGQGHPRLMIHISFVELHSQMLHAKFQNHRPPGSEEEDF